MFSWFKMTKNRGCVILFANCTHKKALLVLALQGQFLRYESVANLAKLKKKQKQNMKPATVSKKIGTGAI